MSMHTPIAPPNAEHGFMAGYLDALALVERLHRLLLDVIKDEFERVSYDWIWCLGGLKVGGVSG